MRKLLIYLNEYRKECILAPLFKLLEASFELVVPLVVAAIIDHGIAASNKSYIFKMGGVMVLLALIGLACSITAQYFAAKAAVGFSTKVRYALFSHIQKLSFSEMDTIGTSTLITRMTSDINQTQSGVNMVLRLFLRSPFIVFWCHDHGIYRGCKGSADFRRYNSTFVGCCFFRDACQYSAV